MTDRAVQPEAPTTKAGRVLLEQEAYNSRSFPLITVEAIVAIEAEARAASQERPPIDVERLGAIIDQHSLLYNDSEAGGEVIGCECGEWNQSTSWGEHVAAALAGGSVASPEPRP
jgi:hypothetical protein